MNIIINQTASWFSTIKIEVFKIPTFYVENQLDPHGFPIIDSTCCKRLISSVFYFTDAGMYIKQDFNYILKWDNFYTMEHMQCQSPLIKMVI